ncbi:MAG: transposase [Melioribacteraceae bacterium]|nr:transposase [Melioribacteraceae bacterium]
MSQTFHRRNLPHLYDDCGKYFITFRLNNSIPINLLKEMAHPKINGDFEKFKRLFMRYDNLLDCGNYGINYLSDSKLSDICKECLLYPHGKEYFLICFCIMPNHVHLIFELLAGNNGISNIMKGIKGVTARKCNLELNRRGKFWQEESYDRLIRDDFELYFVVRYVLLNPVKARLADNWSEWGYSYCDEAYQGVF